MYGRIVDNMRSGQDYYTAAHGELLGGTYGTRSVFNWRLPALSWLVSLLPSTAWAAGILKLAAFAAPLLAFGLLDRTGNRLARLLVVPALAINLVAAAGPQAVLFTDIVAGVLILLSALAYGLKVPIAGLLAALLALFIRELAAPYVVICVFLAWRERRTVNSGHGSWALPRSPPTSSGTTRWFRPTLDRKTSPTLSGWVQFGGLDFVLSTAAFNGFLLIEPLWISAILLPLCLLGLAAWRDPTGLTGRPDRRRLPSRCSCSSASASTTTGGRSTRR